MNSHNLIRFGALAQKHFDMENNFKIINFPADSPPRVRILISFSYLPTSPYEFDEVEFIKFGSTDNFECVQMGYSRRGNALCVKEVRET